MVSRQELVNRSSNVSQSVGTRQRLMTATPQSQASSRSITNYQNSVTQQQQQIAQDISTRQARIDLLKRKLASKPMNTTSAHRQKVELTRLLGEVEYYKEAQKVTGGNQLVRLSSSDATGYATSTLAYQKASYSLDKKRDNETKRKLEREAKLQFDKDMKKINLTVEESFKGDFNQISYLKDNKLIATSKNKPETITVWKLPAEELSVTPETIQERIIPNQAQTVSKVERVKQLVFGSPLKTELVVVKSSLFGTKISDREPTEEESLYYNEQKALQQTPEPVQQQSFWSGLRQAYTKEDTITKSVLSSFGYVAQKSEEGRIELEKKSWVRLIAPKSAQSYIFKTPDVVRTTTASRTFTTAPYFIPGVRNFVLGANAGELLKQKFFGALGENTGRIKLSEKTKEGFLSVAPAYTKSLTREKQLMEAGYDKTTARTFAFASMDLQIGVGAIALQSYLASNPIITKSPKVTTRYLVPEKVNVGGEFAKSRYSILQKTAQKITIEKRGLAIFGQKTSSKVYESFYRLSTVKNVVIKDGNAYGFMRGQRVGAKMSKLFELRGTVTEVPKSSLSRLPKIQKELFGKISRSGSEESIYQLGEVQLKELGKFNAKGIFIPKGETGRTITTSFLGGRTQPLTSVGIKSGVLRIGIPVKSKSLFFTEVYGKKLGEGMPRAGGSIKDLNILTKVTYKAPTSTVKFMQPASIVKTPLSKTFGTQAKFYQFPQPQVSPGIITSSPYQSAIVTSATPVLTQAEALKVASQTAFVTGGAGILIPSARFTIPALKTTDITILGTASLLKTSSAVLTNPLDLLSTKQTPVLISKTTTNQVQDITPITITKTTQKITPVQVIDIVQIQKPVTINPKPVTSFIRPFIPDLSPGTPTKKRIKELLSYGKAYKVYVKKLGKYNALQGVFSKSKAIKIGEGIALETTVASFKIEPTKKLIPIDIGERAYSPSSDVFRTYKIKKGRRVPLVNEWIQRRSKRLGRKSEVTELISKRTKGRKLKFI